MKLDNVLYIRSDRRHGDDALVAKLHTEGYKKLGSRFGEPFDRYVEYTLQEAKLDQRFADKNDRTNVWYAQLEGQTVGCAALVDRGDRAQLRWVVVLEEARGLGLGKKLLNLVLAHARETGFSSIYLETIDELTPSMTLYEGLGFQLVSKKNIPLWYGEDGCEVVMDMRL